MVRTEIKPVINEVGRPVSQGGLYNVIKGPFDSTLVGVVVRKNGAVVEKTAIVGGDLAPKNHFLSGNYLMEGCLKYYNNKLFLIAACREGRDTINKTVFNTYNVTFEPYFSGDWTDGSVTVVNEARTVPVTNGAFSDDFQGEDVHIYKFNKPPRFGGQ